MYVYSNPHPKGKHVKDCVKRAIVHATGLDYMEVQRQLNRYKKVTCSEKFNSNTNWKPFVLNVLKAIPIKIPVEKGKPRVTGETFGLLYPKGKFLLRMAGHLSCCVDGNLIDSWDCSEKCVYNAYQIIGEVE